MLLLNTTDVSVGTKMIASSPLETFPSPNVATMRQVVPCPDGQMRCRAPRLSTSMMLSARFPLVTPAGGVDLPDCPSDARERTYCSPEGENRNRKARFVDGGYYENSGLDTIADLIGGLSRVAEERGVIFTVISFDLALDDVPVRPYWGGELLSPIRALNSARSARILPARTRVEGADSTLLLSSSLDNRSNALTLGWLLSEETLEIIDNDIYEQALCRADPSSRRMERAEGVGQIGSEQQIRLANCSVWTNIANDLNADFNWEDPRVAVDLDQIADALQDGAIEVTLGPRQ